MEKLFIDTNAFLFLLRKEKGRWEAVAEALDNDNNEIYTSTLVLNELKFKLLWLEISEKLKTKNKHDIVKKIKKDDKSRKLVLSKFLKFYLKSKAEVTVLSLTEKEEIPSTMISLKHGLLPSDAEIVATMKNQGIQKILTSDKDFSEVPGIEVEEV